MKSYYFFLIPVKDKNIEVISAPSLGGIRIEQSMFNTINNHFENNEDIQYFLLKSVDEASLSIDSDIVESVISSKSDTILSRQSLLNLILSSFETSCYNKYMAIAQYPLLMISTQKRQVNIYPAQSPIAVLNHLALHFYQFLNIKQCHDQIRKLDSIIQLSDKNYSPAIQTGIKFTSCCVHNLLIQNSTRMIFILKHNCQRMENDKFDNRLCQSVTHLFS